MFEMKLKPGHIIPISLSCVRTVIPGLPSSQNSLSLEGIPLVKANMLSHAHDIIMDVSIALVGQTSSVLR